jgi:hypothetical protein
MCFQHWLWMLLAAAHLVMVVVGASGLLPDANSAPGHSVQWYARMSGADSRFGFYAPAVGSEYRARFVLHDQFGGTWRDVFEEAKSPEARLRQQGIINWGFESAAERDSSEVRQRLVKSWSTTMFKRHPSAVSLSVVIEVYDVPTMSEYRAGSRPSWKTLYQAQVQFDPSAAPERTAP